MAPNEEEQAKLNKQGHIIHEFLKVAKTRRENFVELNSRLATLLEKNQDLNFLSASEKRTVEIQLNNGKKAIEILDRAVKDDLKAETPTKDQILRDPSHYLQEVNTIAKSVIDVTDHVGNNMVIFNDMRQIINKIKADPKLTELQGLIDPPKPEGVDNFSAQVQPLEALIDTTGMKLLSGHAMPLGALVGKDPQNKEELSGTMQALESAIQVENAKYNDIYPLREALDKVSEAAEKLEAVNSKTKRFGFTRSTLSSEEKASTLKEAENLIEIIENGQAGLSADEFQTRVEQLPALEQLPQQYVQLKSDYLTTSAKSIGKKAGKLMQETVNNIAQSDQDPRQVIDNSIAKASELYPNPKSSDKLEKIIDQLNELKSAHDLKKQLDPPRVEEPQAQASVKTEPAKQEQSNEHKQSRKRKRHHDQQHDSSNKHRRKRRRRHSSRQEPSPYKDYDQMKQAYLQEHFGRKQTPDDSRAKRAPKAEGLSKRKRAPSEERRSHKRQKADHTDSEKMMKLFKAELNRHQHDSSPEREPEQLQKNTVTKSL